MFFFFKWVRILPEIDWCHYQGANPAPTRIVRHRTMTRPLQVKCHIIGGTIGVGTLHNIEEQDVQLCLE